MQGAFEQAWVFLKSLPDYIIPVGTYNKRKIAMLHGKPYYTSTATSVSGDMGTKNEGQWYGFGGIEPDFSKWDWTKPKAEWWIKGRKGRSPPDLPIHAQMENFDDTLRSQLLRQYLDDYDDWQPIESGQQVNQLLSSYGFEPPIRGSWDA